MSCEEYHDNSYEDGPPYPLTPADDEWWAGAGDLGTYAQVRAETLQAFDLRDDEPLDAGVAAVVSARTALELCGEPAEETGRALVAGVWSSGLFFAVSVWVLVVWAAERAYESIRV